MGKYKINRQGIESGPWSLKEISAKLEESSLHWTDYVFDDQRKDWVPLFELKALKAQFKSYSGDVSGAADDQSSAAHLSLVGGENPTRLVARLLGTMWFLKTPDGEKGPLEYLNIIGRLQEKKIFEFDHVRLSESDEWKQIAETEAFAPSRIRALKETPEAKVLTMFYRRRHARTEFGVQILLHNDSEVFKGRCVEIGQGGAGLLVNSDRVNMGDSLFLHFKSGEGVPPFTAICTIVSKTQTKAGDFRYGVKFNKVSQAVQQAIHKLAKSQAA
jgi:hypothetical protein